MISFQPFIATCNRRLDLLEVFVDSYLNQCSKLSRPILYYDGEDTEYQSLLMKLNPVEMIKQNITSSSLSKEQRRLVFQYNILHDLPHIMSTKYPSSTLLFLEDDIIFSSQFNLAVNHVQEYMSRYSFIDLVTFYGWNQNYWIRDDYKNFLYQFNGREYYGNLCLAVSPKVINWWYKNQESIYSSKSIKVDWGWDLKIGKGFQDAGFKWWCTKDHYVQHQIGRSAIDEVVKVTQSSRFVK